MKGGMIYFGAVAVFMLVVVVVAMIVSGGFQMLYESLGLMGVVGFIALFVVIDVVFIAMVRRSLKRAMEQGGQGDTSVPRDESQM
jgi:membrane protein implicated in regulation of membrane protease activity